MNSAVRALTPVAYVRDLDASAQFYAVLGFDTVVRGEDGEWSWAYLRCGTVSLLLASRDGRSGDAQAEASHPSQPVQLYGQADDVAQLRERLVANGVPVEHLGYPEHAPGGEIRILDPDGQVIVLAEAAGAPAPESMTDPGRRASMLMRAAEAMRQRSEAGAQCEIGERGGAPCPEPAELKLTDSWGDSAWSCLRHADELLVSARGVFLANQEPDGLASFLARWRRPAS